MEMRLTIAEVVRQQAIENGDARACIYHDAQRSLTFAELDRETNKVANGLLEPGLAGNRRIGILDRNSDVFMEVLLGVAKSDNAFMGINFQLAAPEVQYILEDSQAPVLFVGKEFYSIVEEIESQLGYLSQIIAMDGCHPRWPDYRSWKEGFSAEDPKIPQDFNRDIWQLYTSGTTGRPKGVRISEASFRKAADIVLNDVLKTEKGQTQLLCLPMIHNFGVTMLLFGLMRGSTSVITREWILTKS